MPFKQHSKSELHSLVSNQFQMSHGEHQLGQDRDYFSRPHFGDILLCGGVM